MIDAFEHAFFITAHPDDAELAAGGTIAKLRRRGVRVTVLVLTTSEFNDEARELRRAAARRAAEILDYDLQFFEDGRLDQVEDCPIYRVTRSLDAILDKEQPDAIFTHCDNDSHHDHFLTYSAVIASSRRVNSALLCFPPNELRTIKHRTFQPNLFVDIEDFFDEKVKSLEQYQYEGQNFRQLPIDDVRAANRSFGIVAGCALAEAFQLQFLKS